MKLTLTEKKTKEVDIDFPCYRRVANMYCKCISADKSIEVTTNNPLGCSIAYRTYINPSFFEDGSVEVSDWDFSVKFNDITNLINDITYE